MQKLNNKLFAIGIPTVNQAELLNPNLQYYVNHYPNTQIIVVDNGQQDIFQHENINIAKPKKNKFVSWSWNLICAKAFELYGVQSILMLNDDIDFGHSESHIYEMLSVNPFTDFFVGPDQWCAFLLPKMTWENVGEFDENITCYFGDNDYEFRMKKKGLRILNTTYLKPNVFRRSMSIEKDPMLNLQFEKDRKTYVEKYGGMPGKETKI